MDAEDALFQVNAEDTLSHLIFFPSSFLFIVSFFFLQISASVTADHVRTVPLVLGITKTTPAFVQKAGKENTARLFIPPVSF